MAKVRQAFVLFWVGSGFDLGALMKVMKADLT